MIFAPATKELVKEWRYTHSMYASKLKPNKKKKKKIVKFIKDRYNVKEVVDHELLNRISNCIVNNIFFAQKLKNDSLPRIVAFTIMNDEKSSALYNSQESMWEKCPIFVAVDLETGYLQVEGSCELHDELFAFQGLDKWDIENIVRVSDYISCIKKYNIGLYEELTE